MCAAHTFIANCEFLIDERVFMTSHEAKQYSPLALAYLGDAVYERQVRLFLVKRANMSPGKLHHMGVHLVNAHFQAACANAIEEYLTEGEADILRRGRNAKSFTVPKNTDVSEYRLATGLEALFGYLELIGDQKRIEEIFELIESLANKNRTDKI